MNKVINLNILYCYVIYSRHINSIPCAVSSYTMTSTVNRNIIRSDGKAGAI